MIRSLGSLGPLVLGLLWDLGCSGTPTPSPSPFAEESRLLVVSDTPGPLASSAPVPVLSPPQVFPVWVPSHVDRARDLLVGEHWIFFKLTESEWFTDRRLEEAIPPSRGTADPASLAPLRGLRGFDRAVVPYRESK